MRPLSARARPLTYSDQDDARTTTRRRRSTALGRAIRRQQTTHNYLRRLRPQPTHICRALRATTDQDRLSLHTATTHLHRCLFLSFSPPTSHLTHADCSPPGNPLGTVSGFTTLTSLRRGGGESRNGLRRRRIAWCGTCSMQSERNASYGQITCALHAFCALRPRPTASLRHLSRPANGTLLGASLLTTQPRIGRRSRHLRDHRCGTVRGTCSVCFRDSRSGVDNAASTVKLRRRSAPRVRGKARGSAGVQGSPAVGGSWPGRPGNPELSD